jgi:hypothetical protein
MEMGKPAWEEYSFSYQIGTAIKEGKRPPLDKVRIFREILGPSWDNNPTKRPSFAALLPSLEALVLSTQNLYRFSPDDVNSLPKNTNINIITKNYNNNNNNNNTSPTRSREPHAIQNQSFTTHHPPPIASFSAFPPLSGKQIFKNILLL